MAGNQEATGYSNAERSHWADLEQAGQEALSAAAPQACRDAVAAAVGAAGIAAVHDAVGDAPGRAEVYDHLTRAREAAMDAALTLYDPMRDAARETSVLAREIVQASAAATADLTLHGRADDAAALCHEARVCVANLGQPATADAHRAFLEYCNENLRALRYDGEYGQVTDAARACDHAAAVADPGERFAALQDCAAQWRGERDAADPAVAPAAQHAADRRDADFILDRCVGDAASFPGGRAAHDQAAAILSELLNDRPGMAGYDLSRDPDHTAAAFLEAMRQLSDAQASLPVDDPRAALRLELDDGRDHYIRRRDPATGESFILDGQFVDDRILPLTALEGVDGRLRDQADRYRKSAPTCEDVG